MEEKLLTREEKEEKEEIMRVLDKNYEMLVALSWGLKWQNLMNGIPKKPMISY